MIMSKVKKLFTQEKGRARRGGGGVGRGESRVVQKQHQKEIPDRLHFDSSYFQDWSDLPAAATGRYPAGPCRWGNNREVRFQQEILPPRLLFLLELCLPLFQPELYPPMP